MWRLGTRRYQSDKLFFELKIGILEMLTLNSSTKSDSAASHLRTFFHQNAREASVVYGMALVPFPSPAAVQFSLQMV